MPTVTLYAKAGCHICDEARESLEETLETLSEARDHAPVEILFDEVDIRRDPALFERYRYRIPVIAVDGVERLEGHIGASEVEDLLRSLMERK